MAAASLLGLGYSPVAPGTAGSLGAVALYLVLSPLWWPYYALVWGGFFGLACWTSHRASRALGDHDPGVVVIDEAAGFLAAMFLLPSSAGYIIAGFLLFRLFDIAKPWPASFFDKRVKSGLGIVMDDVVAGAYACILIHIYRLAWG